MALAAGLFGIVVAIEAVHYTSTVGASGDDFTGLMAIPAGIALLGLGARMLWTSRRRSDAIPRRYARRSLKALAVAATLILICFPLGLSYVVTHTARSVVPAASLGTSYERVSFGTSDGLKLKGWYVPSRNGAAVIAFPGRRGPQKPARLLARHGYGVLLFDRRGEGQSEGDPNSFGWGGDKDILAAVDYLKSRDDVRDSRIGGLGLSVGGELMLQVAAETRALKAIVSEGAETRTLSEDVEEFHGLTKVIAMPFLVTKTAAVAVLSSTAPPPKLMDLMPKISVPAMFIHNGKAGEQLNDEYFGAVQAQKSTGWSRSPSTPEPRPPVPREYERRVVGFFNRTLLGRGPS